MRRKPWIETREEFLAIVRQDGPDSVAHRLPVHRATVYRIVHGQTRNPSPLVRDAIQRFVATATAPPDRIEDAEPRTRP